MDIEIITIEQILICLKEMWVLLVNFTNSNFFIVIFSSFAGAFAGAMGAQRIAERAKYRKQLLNEIKVINNIIMITFGIANSLLAFKKSHVISLKQNYDIQKKELEEINKKRKLKLIKKDEKFNMTLHQEIIFIHNFPVSNLRNQFLENLSFPSGRAIGLSTILINSVENLKRTVDERNQFIKLHKINNSMTIEKYFGLQQGVEIDKTYPSLIDSICEQTDTSIFLSKTICEDMNKHGNKTAKEFKRKFKGKTPEISKIDFSQSENKNLIPNSNNYDHLMKMFIETPNEESK